ncbi:MAG: transglycosylase domain-containing protein [Nitriliruptoraceae bacterium]|nr:transglycosylase domain-containing protein [Nitriliruptoraceae bacterium]
MSGASLPRRVVGRLGAISGRLILLAVITVATGLLLGAMILPAALATNDLMEAVRTDVLDVPPLDEADTPPQNSYVYAADGTELAELNFEENRVPVALEDIPQDVINAVLATEDANFYEHEGVNHAAIVRAAAVNFTAGGIESGASTITQQYVKMTFLSPEQTLARKVEEAIYAIQLERELEKDEILERYLNRSYFGRGTYGIGTAAERYFSKPLQELSLGEGAMLAGLLRAPEANNPINNLDNAQARRDIVLRQMAAAGFVSAPQAQAAIDQPLEVEISEPAAPLNPYWSTWVSRLLTVDDVANALGTQQDALAAMGPTFDERRRFVFQSGLRIHTTLDPEMQAAGEAALRDWLTYEDEPPEEIAQEPSGAIVSVEPGTGAIRTMALGPREFGDCAADGSWVGTIESTGQLLCDRTQVNPAVPGGGGSGRQSGSAFKPAVTAAALEAGLSPGLVLDARGPQPIDGCPDDRNESGLWEPGNIGGDAILDMYEAMGQSSNIYHALLIGDVGPPRVAEVFERLSGYPIPERDIFCPMSLGSSDTTPLAMATMYATIANRGEYCAPFPIERIEDANGRVLWEHQPDCRQVMDTEVADRLTDILEAPVTSGTAPVANLGTHPTRGKTGSTNSNVDAWFVGFIKQLSTAAWVGYPSENRVFPDPETAAEFCGEDADGGNVCPRAGSDAELMRNVTIGGQSYSQVFGGTIPAPMWADYMTAIVDRYEPEDFVDPGPIPTGRVPDLLEAESIDEAEDIATTAGFRLEVEETSDWRAAGTFVDQTPDAGTDLALGAIITLLISDGEGEFPELPDVTGLELAEAAEVLFEAGFANVFQRSVETEDEDLIDRVVTMIPGAGTRLDPDDPEGVILEIGIEPEEPEELEEDEDDAEDDPSDDEDEDDGDEDDDAPGNSGNAPGRSEDEDDGDDD